MVSPFHQKLAESLGLDGNATKTTIMVTLDRLLASRDDDPSTRLSDQTPVDPRELMRDLVLAEQRKADAMGQPITFTQALERVRAKPEHAKLDRVLSEFYQRGADARVSSFTLRD
jgi:hypothetical protein